MTITAAADGSALGNPGPAGWAWYVDDGCWAAGGWPHATNNRGELQAVLELFLSTAHLDDDLLVFCDSQYVINAVTKWMRGWKAKGWRKGDGKPVMNVDLLQQLDAALTGRKYRFEWVKGHADHPLNEAADLRARGAAEAFQRDSAVPSGPGWNRAGDPESPNRPVVLTDDIENPGGAAPVGARLAAPRTTRVQEHPGLFDLDDPDPVTDRSVTITLSANEWAGLARRAALERTTPEDAVHRILLADLRR